MAGQPQAPERVVARLRPHARALFWPTLALLVLAGGAGYLAERFPAAWLNIAVPVTAAVLAVLLWLVPTLRFFGRNVTITTRRVVLRDGLLTRSRQELLHSRGYDVTVRRGPLQALFRSGDVAINTGLDRPVVLRDVPDAELVQQALLELMERSQNPVAVHRQSQQSRPRSPQPRYRPADPDRPWWDADPGTDPTRVLPDAHPER